MGARRILNSEFPQERNVPASGRLTEPPLLLAEIDQTKDRAGQDLPREVSLG